MQTNTRSTLAVLLLLLSITPVAATYAAKVKVKEYTFDLADIDKVDIHASVGSINIIHTDTKKASVVLEIRQQNRHWYQSDIDLDAVELDSHTRGKGLVLRQDDNDLNIDWTIELPTVADTSIELGVGKIEGKLGDTRLYVNLGVGDVDLGMPLATTGDIDLASGVGQASLRGAESNSHKHSFVSQSVEGHGNGDNNVRIKVGVGNAGLRLEHTTKP